MSSLFPDVIDILIFRFLRYPYFFSLFSILSAIADISIVEDYVSKCNQRSVEFPEEKENGDLVNGLHIRNFPVSYPESPDGMTGNPVLCQIIGIINLCDVIGGSSADKVFIDIFIVSFR